jgi:hypothetical protein
MTEPTSPPLHPDRVAIPGLRPGGALETAVEASRERKRAALVLTDEELARLDAELEAERERRMVEVVTSRRTTTTPATATSPAASVTTTVVAPGASTSEGKRTLFQQVAGLVLTVLAGALGAWGAEKGNELLTMLGGVLASAGMAMSGHAANVYTRARTAAKVGPFLALLLLLPAIGCGSSPPAAPTMAFYAAARSVAKDARVYYTADPSLTDLERQSALLRCDSVEDFIAEAVTKEIVTGEATP